MAEKVQKVGVKKQDGYLYFVDKAGDVSRARMARAGKKGGKAKAEKSDDAKGEKKPAAKKGEGKKAEKAEGHKEKA